MNAIPPTMLPDALGCSAFGQEPASLSTLRWTALQNAANVVASLAELEPEHASPEIGDFPALMRGAAPWRRELADRGIEDMTAVMTPGISALLGISSRGADCGPAAMALWREFSDARAAVLTLLEPIKIAGPAHAA